jgi:hypothetical protein
MVFILIKNLPEIVIIYSIPGNFVLASSTDFVDDSSTEILGLHRRPKPGIGSRQTAAIIFDDRPIIQFSLISNYGIT